MIKKLLLVFMTVSLFQPAEAQKETDNWFFGVLAKLDFTSGTPVAGMGPVYTSEGCSAISTSTGNVMFYTDGSTVWDGSNTIMPNGTGLHGNVSSTQSALIVPSPSVNSQYYIFTTDADGGLYGFQYSQVDMTLAAGMGDIVTATKNTMVLDSVDEKIAAIRTPAGDSYWIVVHRWGNNAFYAYRLTPSGLMPPVISNVGTVHNTTTFQNTYGQMKFNMCGDKLAVAVGYQNIVELLDFNINTGVISNPQTLSFAAHVYGVEFSKNSTYLYVSCYDAAGTLDQFNISSGLALTIAATKVPLTTTPDIYGLQIASDGKIYCARSFNQYMASINSPDLAGFSCGYTDSGVDMDPTFSGVTNSLGLPGFMQTFLKNATGVACTTDIDPGNEMEQLSVYPNPAATQFSIDLGSLKDAEISVFDPAGKLIEKAVNANGTFEFGSAYSKGIYFVNVKGANSARTIKVGKL
jgi:hypothetical protein